MLQKGEPPSPPIQTDVWESSWVYSVHMSFVARCMGNYWFKCEREIRANRQGCDSLSENGACLYVMGRLCLDSLTGRMRCLAVANSCPVSLETGYRESVPCVMQNLEFPGNDTEMPVTYNPRMV